MEENLLMTTNIQVWLEISLIFQVVKVKVHFKVYFFVGLQIAAIQLLIL